MRRDEEHLEPVVQDAKIAKPMRLPSVGCDWKNNVASNLCWKSVQDPNSQIAEIKDCRLPLAQEAEDAAKLSRGAVLPAMVQPADPGSTTRMWESPPKARRVVRGLKPRRLAAVVADEGYCKEELPKQLHVRSMWIHPTEPDRKRRCCSCEHVQHRCAHQMPALCTSSAKQVAAQRSHRADSRPLVRDPRRAVRAPGRRNHPSGATIRTRGRVHAQVAHAKPLRSPRRPAIPGTSLTNVCLNIAPAQDLRPAPHPPPTAYSSRFALTPSSMPVRRRRGRSRPGLAWLTRLTALSLFARVQVATYRVARTIPRSYDKAP